MEEVLSEDFVPTEDHVGKTVYIRPKGKKIGTETYTMGYPEKKASIVQFPYIKREVLKLGSTSHKDVRILSYNVMAEKSNRGKKHHHFPLWGLRKQLLVKEILAYDPDIICLQEVLPEYYTYCEERLGKFDYIGKCGSRGNGVKQDIWEATFYKSNRFECTDKETFKYADKAKDLQNEVSKEFYNHPHIALFLKLKFTDVDDAKEFVMVNTHLSGPKSNANLQTDVYQRDVRLFQAKMLCDKLRSLYLDRQQSTIIIVCGDFNSVISSEPYKFLARGGEIDLKHAYDVFEGWEKWGTTFLLKQNQQPDHIWHRGGLECNGVLKILPYKNSTLLPSDHAPIMACFSLKGFLPRRVLYVHPLLSVCALLTSEFNWMISFMGLTKTRGLCT